MMRRIVTKSLAVLATTAALTVAGAGLASADTTVDEDNTSNVSKQTDVRDSGNINIEDLADLGVDLGDLNVSDLPVLSGNDTDVSDVGNGDNANGNASGNESNSSSDTSADGGEDNNSGLLGGLL